MIKIDFAPPSKEQLFNLFFFDILHEGFGVLRANGSWSIGIKKAKVQL
jgi:hypothetical protein